MEDKIDYGKIQVPTNWNEITLKQFQKINSYYDDKDKKFNIIDVVDIMIDKDRDYVMSLPSDFLNIILEKLQFLQEQPKQEEPSNKIEIDGETYVINVMEKLKTGEYIAVDSVMKNDKNDYASILAILCRKQGEIYDSKFEAETFEERKKMFEQQPITKILPTLSFFLQLYIVSQTHSHLYSQVEEAINHTAKSINNSTKIGVGGKLYLNWRMRKLRKLLRSNKST